LDAGPESILADGRKAVTQSEIAAGSEHPDFRLSASAIPSIDDRIIWLYTQPWARR
jgi:hypothetical protein